MKFTSEAGELKHIKVFIENKIPYICLNGYFTITIDHRFMYDVSCVFSSEDYSGNLITSLRQNTLTFDDRSRCIRAIVKDYENEDYDVDNEEDDDIGYLVTARFKISFSDEGWDKLNEFLEQETKNVQIRKLKCESTTSENGECDICEENGTIYKLKCCKVNSICETCFINMLNYETKLCPFCRHQFESL